MCILVLLHAVSNDDCLVHKVYCHSNIIKILRQLSYLIKNSKYTAWYDIELSQYQKERQETELERIFDERNAQLQESGINLAAIHQQPKVIREPETEWQKNVKGMKNEEYYNKLQGLENEQVIKEVKLREQSHQFAIPGEKIVHSSVARGMAQKYEESL